MIGHDRAFRRITFSGFIKVLSPLYVGSGQDAPMPSPIDMRPFMVETPEGIVPVIPGSSLKGVLRTISERIVNSTNNISCCDPISDNNCYNKIKEQLKKYLERGDNEGVRQLLEEELCIVCKIFGSPGYLSHVIVEDSMAERYSLETRPGIAISRKSGTVRQGPFFVEYISPGSLFTFRISFSSIENYKVGLVATAINELNSGRAYIGGFKSKGFGRVEFLIQQLDVSDGYKDGQILQLTDEDYAVKVSMKNIPAGKSIEEVEEELRKYTNDVLRGFMEAWSSYVSKKAR